jgi:hypothetical protein
MNAEWHRAYDAGRQRMGTLYLETQRLVTELKRKPCMDCGGIFPPECMDFDHRDPSDKVQGVSRLVFRRYSRDRILAEIAKCDLICANCHRIRTHAA